MSNYCVESAESLSDLVEQVNEMLKAGYHCVGGICITLQYDEDTRETYRSYYQAMQKDE